MAALRSRCAHYIFMLWILLLLFSRLISSFADWMSAIYFHTWCGLSANLRCRSETCCTRLAENTERKKSPKNHHLGTMHRTKLLGYIFATKACSDNRKKLLNSNISSTCSHNFGPLAAEIVSFGEPQQISTGFCVLASLYCSDVTQRKPTKLCTMIDRLLGWYTIYTFSRAPAPWQNFALCKTLYVQVLRSPILTVLRARHSSSGRQVNFAAWYTRNGIRELSQRALPIFGWAAITLGIGPHSSYCMEMFIFQTPYML